MSFDSRLLNIKYNLELSKVFESVENKNQGLSSKTPIPNQLFAPGYTDDFDFTKITFMEEAYSSLQRIRELDHIYTSKTFNSKKKTHPIKFLCYGYKDFDGHIIITEIDCPLLDELAKKKLSSNEELAKFVELFVTYSKTNRETQTYMREYLRNFSFNEPPIGTHIVALIGQTMPATLDSSIQNTFNMGELNSAVLPDKVKFEGNHGLISGIIGIAQKTVNYSALLNKKARLESSSITQDGSLECAVISYTKRPNNTVMPTNVVNITEASRVKDGKELPLLISSSPQPLDYLYKAKHAIPIFERI